MTIRDITIWGSENLDGTAVELIDDGALNNAMISFLMSKRGDFILDPELGGPLDSLTFKNLSPGNIGSIKFLITNALNIYFDGLIKVLSIMVTPDYENRLNEVEIIYTSLLSDEDLSAKIFINDTSKLNFVTYQEIEYIGDNLLAFVQVKKPDLDGKKLVYNTELLCWIWGNMYKFINFSISDTKFEEILAYCNM